ncbi:N-acetylated-alpha-linked acidic dipeptidase 2-like isoform X6 [Ceratina calcarata]|uniref:N-acetylated-alpha-linked acidic dipeptidase 2-like isoform X6 n=1 Tax=Ceratina calcarata TaxID=156304 RepID=A0AAJ7S3M2_9HYME|nr:N-acetylated-alpha-linked acidic dipeptidase 2-like isoform X6 [Ceratina calcarata]XP_026670845.1 N-acetylated-alpha-linked acidic dipeptidase 2-like isoform X6 [Ceratina calcarata]
MQRVLSFQMARGLSESSEFVTKRMCFSLIFSVGFVALLCGFLLGRFTTQRAIDFRAEKRRLELAGNGLESTEYLQRFIFDQLERAPLDSDFETNWESLKEDDVHRVNGILSNLSLIQKVDRHQSYVVATAKGSREPDRYVVLSASGESVGIALELAKIFNQIQRENRWKPRRSLVFCLFSGSSNPCIEKLSSFMPHRIVAYIVVHHQALQGKGPLIVSGSDIAQSIVLESAGIVKGWLSYNNNQLLYLSKSIYNTSFSRLAVDIPHAIVTFMNDTVMYNEHQHERVSRKILLAQILGQTIWRLSESLIIKWNPSYFNETAYTTLDWVNNGEDKENVQRSLDKLLNNVKTFNRKIDTVDSINSLDTRILNDVLLDLDRVLLCPDKEHRSKTDWSLFLKPSHDLLGSTYLSEVVKCYENAIQLLQENIDL